MRQMINLSQNEDMSQVMCSPQNINVAQTTIYSENNKNFAPARKEKMLDWWLFGFLLIIIAEIVIDMIL